MTTAGETRGDDREERIRSLLPLVRQIARRVMKETAGGRAADLADEAPEELS